MKRIVAVVVSAVLSAPAVGANVFPYAPQYVVPSHPTLYPNGRGGWTATPPAPKSSPRAPWDGQIYVPPQSFGKPVGNKNAPVRSKDAKNDIPTHPNGEQGKIPGPAPGRSHEPGTGIEFDIEGMAQLHRTVEAAKALKEYKEWLNQVAAAVARHFQGQPTTLAQLKQLGYQPKAAQPKMQQDVRQSEMMQESGEELVMQALLDRGGVIQQLNALGIEVSTGSKDEEDVFADVYSRYAQEEANRLRKLVEDGKQSTRKMRERAEQGLREFEQSEKILRDTSYRIRSEPEGTVPNPPVLAPILNQEFARVQSKVDRIDATTPQGAEFKSLANSAMREAAISHAANLVDDAKWFLGVASGIADVAVGIDPITGFYRSLIESVSGHNAITFEKLSSVERSLAVLGVLTSGGSTSAMKLIQLVGRLGGKVEFATRLVQMAQKGGHSVAGILKGGASYLNWLRRNLSGSLKNEALQDLGRTLFKEAELLTEQGFEIRAILSPDEANEAYLMAMKLTDERIGNVFPFSSIKLAFDVSAKNVSSELGRVYHTLDSNLQKSTIRSAWSGSSKEILNVIRSGKPEAQVSDELKALYALRDLPHYYSGVKVEKGDRFLAGIARPNFDGPGGGVQYFSLQHLEAERFSKGKLFSEVIRGH